MKKGVLQSCVWSGEAGGKKAVMSQEILILLNFPFAFL